MKGRKGFPIKKFNNRNIAPSIHKDNLSRFIDCLLYCSTGLEGVLQMLVPQCLIFMVCSPNRPFRHGATICTIELRCHYTVVPGYDSRPLSV